MTRINSNINALNALKSLSDVNDKLSVAQLRLATGKRINSAADDAAGYSIAKKFNVRSEGLGQAINNIGSAKNAVAVAEGHLNNIVEILTRMKVKTIQGADDSLGTAERKTINAELEALASQIDLNVTQATWNGKSLLTGSRTYNDSSSLFNFQIGAGDNAVKDTLKFDLLNTSNVQFNIDSTYDLDRKGNTGFTSHKLNLRQTKVDLSKSFAEAGFKNTPKGSISVNGVVFNLSNYSTVQQFMDAINNNPSTEVNFTYDATLDQFFMANLNAVASYNVDVSETGTEDVDAAFGHTINGFFAQVRFGAGMIFGMSRSFSLAPGATASSYTGLSVPDIDISSTTAPNFIIKIDNAIKDVSSALSYIGSTVNRLTYQENSLIVAKTNTDAAKSRIEDADMALEQLQLTKFQITQQTASAMLAQANTSPQAIMSLFK